MAEFRGRLLSTEEDRKILEELIVDYACKNYMDDVVAAFAAKRGCTCFNNMRIPHLRMAMFIVHSTIQREDVTNFETSLQLLGKVHSIAPDLVPIKKYIKLITGLKTKILLNKLSQKTFDYADVSAHLNRHFPKSELKTKGVTELESQINSYQLRFRRRLTRLMLSPSERDAYRSNDLDNELMVSIQQQLRIYIDGVNRELPEPVIEQIIAEGPQSQIALEFQDSQSDGLDQLLSKIFKGAPSQDALLSILKSCWEAEDATPEDTDISDMEILDNTRDAVEGNDFSSSDIFACPVPTEILESPPSIATQKSHHQDPFTSQNTVDKVKKTNHDSITREKMQENLSSAVPKTAHQAQCGWMNDEASPFQFPDAVDVVESASCYMEISNVYSGVRKTKSDFLRHYELLNSDQGTGTKQRAERICFGSPASENDDLKIGWASKRVRPKLHESVASKELAHGRTTNRTGFTATGERFTSIREGFTTTGNGFTPLREGFASIGKGFQLIGKTVMPTSEGFTVIGKGINLIGEGFTLITDGFRSIAEGFTLIEEGVNPINVGLALIREGFTSIREGFTFIREGFTFIREGFTSISLTREEFAPLSEGFTVIREGIMSINKGFTPISDGLAPLNHREGFTAIGDGFTAIGESQGENMVGVAPSMSKCLPATSVSRSRIYLSKNHPRTKPQRKGSPNKRKACQEQAQWQFTSTGTEKISQILKNYNRNECDVVYVSPAYLTSDPSNSQVSKSSHGSQHSTSDKSNCSLSILAGLPVGRSFPIDPQRMLGGMTSLEEEMRELASVIHNPVVPDLHVYPITTSDNLVPPEPTSSGGSPKVVPETPLSEQPDGNSALRQVSDHDNTDGHRENKCNHASDDQGVPKPEHVGACLTTDIDGETVDLFNSTYAKEKCPAVLLRRLSEDIEAKKYLNCSEACEDAGELSSGGDSSSDSYVSDSDDGTGSWSDSSSLPSVELRPDSEIPFVRRIPTLKRYLHTSPKKDITEGPIQMRECTVRLYKMKPKDIIALTKAKKRRYKRSDFTQR